MNVQSLICTCTWRHPRVGSFHFLRHAVKNDTVIPGRFRATDLRDVCAKVLDSMLPISSCSRRS